MATDNSDHYKYMPKQPGMPPLDEEKETLADSGMEADIPVSLQEEIDLKEIDPDEYLELDEEIVPDGTPVAFKVLYGVFSPLLIPSYISLIIFLLSVLVIIVPSAVIPFTLTVFGATCIIPLIAVYVLMRVGVIHSLEMYGKNERIVPYVIETLALAGIALFFHAKGANLWIWTMYCGGAAASLVNFILNFKMRISSHCTGMGAFVAALIVINSYGFPQVSLFWWMVGALFFAGVVGSLAISYGRHTLWEVIAGYATGFLGVILFSLIN